MFPLLKRIYPLLRRRSFERLNGEKHLKGKMERAREMFFGISEMFVLKYLRKMFGYVYNIYFENTQS